jgi:hypothetical protein
MPGYSAGHFYLPSQNKFSPIGAKSKQKCTTTNKPRRGERKTVCTKQIQPRRGEIIITHPKCTTTNKPRRGEIKISLNCAPKQIQPRRGEIIITHPKCTTTNKPRRGEIKNNGKYIHPVIHTHCVFGKTKTKPY